MFGTALGKVSGGFPELFRERSCWGILMQYFPWACKSGASAAFLLVIWEAFEKRRTRCRPLEASSNQHRFLLAQAACSNWLGIKARNVYTLVSKLVEPKLSICFERCSRKIIWILHQLRDSCFIPVFRVARSLEDHGEGGGDELTMS